MVAVIIKKFCWSDQVRILLVAEITWSDPPSITHPTIETPDSVRIQVLEWFTTLPVRSVRGEQIGEMRSYPFKTELDQVHFVGI